MMELIGEYKVWASIVAEARMRTEGDGCIWLHMVAERGSSRGKDQMAKQELVHICIFNSSHDWFGAEYKRREWEKRETFLKHHLLLCFNFLSSCRRHPRCQMIGLRERVPCRSDHPLRHLASDASRFRRPCPQEQVSLSAPSCLTSPLTYCHHPLPLVRACLQNITLLILAPSQVRYKKQ